MMDEKKLAAVLPFIVPKILEHLCKDRGLSFEESANVLYGSRLYAVLESPETGLWHLSPLTLYNLLVEELSTGNITFPMEQS